MATTSLTQALQETLALFEEGGPPQTTTEVAERLDIGRRSTYERLNRLVEQDRLETKKVGGNGRVWWRPLGDAMPTLAGCEVPPVTAIHDEAGEQTVTRDVTDRREYEAELREQRDYTRKLLETVPTGVVIVERDGTFSVANQQAEKLLDLDRREDGTYTVGINAVYDENGEFLPPDERPYVRVFETGETIQNWHGQLELSNGTRRWLSANATPISRNGSVERVLVAITDISQLKAQARRLERQRDDLEAELEEVFERVAAGFYALDEEWRFAHINERAEEFFGHSEEELIGRQIWEVLPAAVDDIEGHLHRAMEAGEPVSTEVFSEPLDAWLEIAAYPSETGLSVYFQEITERKEREQELARYKSIVEAVNEGVYVVDADRNFTWVNEAYAEMLGYSREELLGENATKVTADVDVIQEAEAIEEEYGPEQIPRMELELETASGDRVPVAAESGVLPDSDESDWFRAGVVRDITERKKREQKLRDAKLQLEAAAEAGAVGTWEWRVQEDEFVAGPSFARTFGVDPDAAREGVSLDRFLSAIHEDDRDRIERRVAAAVEACGEYEEEYRVRNADGEVRWVLARGHVECDEDGNPVTFPGALVDVTERKEREQKLQRQRERLAAINDLYGIVREITDAVIDQTTRAEIESIVCERLAAAEPYEFAWIGEIDTQTESIKPRVEAGVDGYVEEIPISTDTTDPAGQGPGGEALRTGEMQVTQDAFTDPDFGPWREHARAYGYRSAAAIPIRHEETLYGLLAVYADRRGAFGGEEREVFAQLGEIVGHAIAATERKRALMSDEVVELQFRIRDIFDALDIDGSPAGTIRLEHVVPIEDDDFLVYGTASPEAVDSVGQIAQTLPHWDDVTFRTDYGTTAFELRLSAPPVLSKVATVGGSVETAVIEDGDYQMTIHLAPSADVRQIIDTVEANYPDAEMIKRHQTTQHNVTLREEQNEHLAGLTDRQRTALEAAVYAGYFEWPRDAAAEDVAESLGIAPSTFHQHLRKAQKSVFESVFSAPASVD